MNDSITIMKQRILDMAIRGELVKQYNNEGFSKDLLLEIKEEKKQLIRDQVIKKEKNYSDINEKEIPFEIPENWEWTKFGTVINNIFGGGTPSKSNPDFWNGEIPWATVKDISDKDTYLNSTMDFITDKGFNNCSGKMINSGDIIIITRMGLGRIVISHIDTAINQDLKGIKLNSNVVSKLFIYFYKAIKIKGTGTTVKGIKQEELLNTAFPLPPLAEQERIVSKIESLFSIVDKIAESKDNTLQIIDQIRKTTLQDAIRGNLVKQNEKDEPVSDLIKKINANKEQLIQKGKIKKLTEVKDEDKPFDIPENWEWTRLREIGNIVGGGTPKTNIKEYWENGTIPWLSPSDLSNHKKKYISNGYKNITELGLNKSSAKLLPTGSVLFSSRAPIGYVVIAENPISTNQGFKSLTPYVTETNNYIYYYLQAFIEDIKSRSSGTTFKEISGKEFGKSLIPLPPLAEQKRIVRKLEMIMDICNKVESLTEGSEVDITDKVTSQIN